MLSTQPRPQPAHTCFAPLTAQDLSQVVGGCSNPKGCTTLDQGLPIAALRQPGLPAFADPARGLLPPLVLAQ